MIPHDASFDTGQTVHRIHNSQPSVTTSSSNSLIGMGGIPVAPPLCQQTHLCPTLTFAHHRRVRTLGRQDGGVARGGQCRSPGPHSPTPGSRHRPFRTTHARNKRDARAFSPVVGRHHRVISDRNLFFPFLSSWFFVARRSNIRVGSSKAIQAVLCLPASLIVAMPFRAPIIASSTSGQGSFGLTHRRVRPLCLKDAGVARRGQQRRYFARAPAPSIPDKPK